MLMQGIRTSDGRCVNFSRDIISDNCVGVEILCARDGSKDQEEIKIFMKLTETGFFELTVQMPDGSAIGRAFNVPFSGVYSFENPGYKLKEGFQK